MFSDHDDFPPLLSTPAFSTLAILPVSHFLLPHFQSPQMFSDHDYKRVGRSQQLQLRRTVASFMLAVQQQRNRNRSYSVRSMMLISANFRGNVHVDFYGGVAKILL